jgi:hypothetical protein
MSNINSSPTNQAGSPPDNAVDGRPSITMTLTDKALASIEGEAKARNLTVERLARAVLADFLNRNAKTRAARNQPLVLHFPGRLRGVIVAAAKAEGVSINQFMVNALADRLAFKLRAGTQESEARP